MSERYIGGISVWVGYWCAGCLDVRCWNDDDPRTEKGLEEDSVQLIFRDACGLRCVCESRSVWWMWRVAVFPEMCVISMFLFVSKHKFTFRIAFSENSVGFIFFIYLFIF